MRHDLGLGEAAHLLANGVKRLVEPGIAEARGPLRALDQLDHAGARLRRRAVDERADGRGEKAEQIAVSHAELVHAHDLALAHHHPAEQLGEVFARADLGEQALHLAETALALHALRIARDLLDGSGVGGDPGEPVRRALLALERRRIDLAAGRDLGGDGFDGAVPQGGGSFGGLVEERDELGRGGGRMPPDGFDGSQSVLLMQKPMVPRPRKRAPRVKSNRNL